MKQSNPFKPITFFEVDVEPPKKEYHEIVNKLIDADILKLSNEMSSPIRTDYFAVDKSQEAWDFKMDLWGGFILGHLREHLAEFLDSLNAVDLAFTDIWTQISNGFQSHHPHAHGDVGYSFVWYIDVDKDKHEGTYYYSPYNLDDTWQAECIPGKFIIWPSWLLHYQPPSNSSLDRCVISGNIKIIEND